MQEDEEKGGSGTPGAKMYTYLARGKARAKWLLQVTKVRSCVCRVSDRGYGSGYCLVDEVLRVLIGLNSTEDW